MAREDGAIITIKTPNHPMLAVSVNGVAKAPGKGEFSVEGDKEKVGRVIFKVVWKKLHSLLNSGDLHGYRFLLNLHRAYFDGVEDLHPIQSLVPNFETEIDPVADADGFIMERFLHDNLFKSICDRDAAGWSPLCYAVLTGRVTLVSALLKGKADVNDRITKMKRDANLTKHLPVLSLAATYHATEVLRLLLSQGARVNDLCVNHGTALGWAGVGDNASAVQVLLEARVDPHLKAFPDVSPFRTTCICGSVAVMKEILRVQGQHMPQVSLRFCLHTALAFEGQSNAITCLIEAKADVNERLQIPMSRRSWWGLLKIYHAAHYVSPSKLTTLAYHHYGASPLIFSILTGKFECIPILLAAGARLDIPNDRGKTASDFLQQMSLTESCVQIRSATNGANDEDSDDCISI